MELKKVMKVRKINNEVMKEIENNGLFNLSYVEQIEITGGTDPGDLLHDIGYVIGKIGGWIKNATVYLVTSDNRPGDEWMLDVDPKVLFG